MVSSSVWPPLCEWTASSHRVVVYSQDGTFLRHFGTLGTESEQLNGPASVEEISVDEESIYLYLAEGTTVYEHPAFAEELSLGRIVSPPGWLPCDGPLLPVSDYPALFSILNTVYGGNGSSNFALPDFRGPIRVEIEPFQEFFTDGGYREDVDWQSEPLEKLKEGSERTSLYLC